MGSFWLWGWWFFLTLPEHLSYPLFIYMVHFESEFTSPLPHHGEKRPLMVPRGHFMAKNDTSWEHLTTKERNIHK
jgi:hypothetical protein